MISTQDFIVGLDIGTTKICVLVGRKNEHGKIEIVGEGKADSLGVMRGVVANIDKTVDAIKKAVKEAEDSSGVEIKYVYVGIAGQHIRSMQHRGQMMRGYSETEITEADVKQMIVDMRRLAVPAGDRIIDVLPQEFIVDNETGITEPIGMCGAKLEADFHIITGQVSAIQNIRKCVEKAGLELVEMFLEPHASSAAVLSDEEKEAGVALIDIGGGTSDIAIFHNEIIRHTAVVPFGGNIITEDIKEGCQVMRAHAELLKVRFGSALEQETQENQVVSIPGLRGREPREISVRNLSRIIQARMEEVIEMLDAEILSSTFKHKLIGGVVLTGGGSYLKHLVQLVQFKTGMDARIGLPTEHLAPVKIDKLKHPMYSTCVGLILKGIEDFEMKEKEQMADLAKRKAALLTQQPQVKEEVEVAKEEENEEQPVENKKERKSIFNGIWKGIKDTFADDIDEEFTTKN
ncbi:MAG TPA: cell division protein FtsA [Bacteroidetes bacterium]|nr:cell division protein FtsA [Bacteroidota bacterium]